MYRNFMLSMNEVVHVVFKTTTNIVLINQMVFIN